MRSNFKLGTLAGLAAGILFGVLLQITYGRTPAGNRIVMMELIAEMAGSTRFIVGWLYHLFDCAVIGGIFGVMMGQKIKGYRDGLKYGPLYGLGWWLLGGLILGPFFVGMSVLSPETMSPIPPLALHSLVGHVLFGLILGGAFVALRNRGIQAKVRENRPKDAEPIRRVS